MKVIQLFLMILFVCCVKKTHCKNEPVKQFVKDLRVLFYGKPNDKGRQAWTAGVKCLYNFAELYFERRDQVTRAFNIVTTQVYNLSMPAAFIQRYYLQRLNEQAVGNLTRKMNYQVRVMSDAKSFDYDITNTKELVLADYYVIILDDVNNLEKILHDYLMRSVSWNPGAKFLILYHNIDERNQSERTSMRIFSELITDAFVTNVAVLYATSATTYDLVALRYYHEIDCRKLRTHVFGQCDDGRFTPSKLVLKAILYKLFNAVSAKNCTFYLCASIWAPFVEDDCIQGIELKMVDFLRERLHFIVNTTCSYEQRGVMESSGAYNGLLGKLNNRTCDFVFGGFYPDDDVVIDFWVTDCYMQDSYTWFVKLAEHRPVWLALYKIFEHNTWLGLIGLLVSTWLLWYILVNILPEPKDSKEISITGLNTLGVFLTSSIQERPLCHATRIFFVAFNLYALNLTAIFVSKLISVFTNPGFMHQINKLSEVVEAGIPFGGPVEAHDWFENDEDAWIVGMYNYSSDFTPNTVNLEEVKKGRKVILCSRMYALQHPISDYIWGTTGNVFSSPVQMIMKPGFILRYEINLLIQRMSDFGIFDKINDDFIYNNSYLNRIAKMRPEFTERVIVLTLEHLRAPFVLLCLGLGLGFLIFIGEFLLKRDNICIKKLKLYREEKHVQEQCKQRRKLGQRIKVKNIKMVKCFKQHEMDTHNEIMTIPWNMEYFYDAVDSHNKPHKRRRKHLTSPHRRIFYE